MILILQANRRKCFLPSFSPFGFFVANNPFCLFNVDFSFLLTYICSSHKSQMPTTNQLKGYSPSPRVSRRGSMVVKKHMISALEMILEKKSKSSTTLDSRGSTTSWRKYDAPGRDRPTRGLRWARPPRQLNFFKTNLGFLYLSPPVFSSI